MPSSLTSPPPSVRASASRSPDMMRSPPPVPFALPSSYVIRSPRQHSAFSPGPSSPALISRSPSTTSSSFSGSNYSQQVATPPPTRSKRDKLLPAIPLSIDTHLPKSKRPTPIDFHAVAQELVGSITLPETSPSAKRHSGRRQATHIPSPELSPCPRRSRNSPSALGPESTPPRPRRRRASGSESLSDLLVPRPAYARAASPASINTTNSTISALSEAPTPKARLIPDRPAPLPPHSVGSYPDRSVSGGELSVTPLAKKRDSTQRRLSALRGLVIDLDFTQHWSIPEPSEPTETVQEVFWACGEPIDSDASDISISDSEFSIIDTKRPRRNTESTPPFVSNPQLASPPMDVTPARPTPRRLPSSTPPRPPRLFRSSSYIQSKTPDPPRPASRQRRDFTGVASSGYSKCFDRAASPEELTPPLSTWRAGLSNDAIHDELLRRHGPMEIKRQEIMWEMCETEKSFVKSMKTVLMLFATPLKTPQGKWIDGISERITELFDLLECVVQVHSAISSVQRDLRRTSEVVEVAAFVGMFKGWIDRLKVHEYYLLCFEAVVQLVEDNVRDVDSVFGEFVRMQMKEEVLGSMSLGSMLLKPVQRLTKYPLFLKRLLDVTPHPHPSQPDILSLLTKTESIILNLQATKAREDDLHQLEHLESHISGLPPGFKLTVPGRKLLAHGQVIRIAPKDGSPGAPRSRAGSIHSSRGSISSSVSSSISPWGDNGQFRISNFSTSSCSSYGPPSRSNSLVHDTGCSPRNANASVTSVHRSPSTASASSVALSMNDWRPPTPSSAKSGGNSRSSRRKEEALVMLIFDDLVLVGQAAQERGLFSKKKKEGDRSIRVLPENDGGVGKVVDVRDWSGWQGHASLFTLTMVSATDSTEMPITHAFSVPPNPSPISKLKGDKNVLGPSITSLPHFITTLCQATSTPSASDDGTAEAGMGVLTEYLAEEKDIGARNLR